MKSWPGAWGAKLVAGVDEVGRGSLFGPVVAAAVILDPSYRIRGLRDSKLLDRETRENSRRAFASTPGLGNRRRRCCHHRPDQYLLGFEARHGRSGRDAPRCGPTICSSTRCASTATANKRRSFTATPLSASIAAASIIAKVERDAMISAWDPVFPEYGLASNKGYSTPTTSEDAARERADAVASAVVRAGVDIVGSAGGSRVHAGGENGGALKVEGERQV
jgi:ribonuclease HII